MEKQPQNVHTEQPGKSEEGGGVEEVQLSFRSVPTHWLNKEEKRN